MADFSKLGAHTRVFRWTKSAGIMRKSFTDNTSMVDACYPSTANKKRKTGTAFNLNLCYSVDLLNLVFSNICLFYYNKKSNCNNYTGQQNWLFFVLKQNHLFLYNFGSLSPNPASVFFYHVRILQYCQFHSCQVWKLVFRVFRKNYGRYRKSNLI